MKITELYSLYPGILLIHGISRNGAESFVPHFKSLVDRINYSILNSKTKLSTYSFKENSESNYTNYFGHIGLIISEGEIIYAKSEDTGYTKSTLLNFYDETKVDWQEVLNPQTYNEIIVRDVSVSGLLIHFIGDFSLEEVKQAGNETGLDVFVNQNNVLLRI